MSDARQDALVRLREAVKAAGGAVSVAARAGVPQTHLSTITSGKRELGRETFGRLADVLPDVPAEVWNTLLKPAPKPAKVTIERESEAGA